MNKFENRIFSVNDFTATISPPSSNHDWTDIFKPANLSPSNGLIFVKSQRGVPVCTVLDLTQCMSCYMYYIIDNKPETIQESWKKYDIIQAIKLE